MARTEIPNALSASVLDRLIDPESDGTPARPGCTIDQIIDSVRRDLEDLLNTHCTRLDIPAHYVESERSILTYGMPDLAAFQATKAGAAAKVAEKIEKAIARFEPRLTNVRASLIDDHDEKQLKLKFQVHATLRVEPSPDVAFVTILKISTGEASIQRVDT
ncbi:Gene 25-like lysozyme [Aquisphaera giovannonii]|uniref:Gene 25-like lysozyme n=1 Tax=Aquisphaera giovannonii TaxID=406548 RepID=A0A5B9W0K5_9BACT|nr:type VI secretion system baseplate subunit TssE [Aquisphaera giovannonii]QEH33817.1 Gene 25-like lysozyme [Aquisphaera giovannonii]